MLPFTFNTLSPDTVAQDAARYGITILHELPAEPSFGGETYFRAEAPNGATALRFLLTHYHLPWTREAAQDVADNADLVGFVDEAINEIVRLATRLGLWVELAEDGSNRLAVLSPVESETQLVDFINQGPTVWDYELTTAEATGVPVVYVGEK